MASVSARRMPLRLVARDGSATTTVAVVPRARKDRAAMQDCADATVEVLTSVDVAPEVTTGGVVVVVGGEVSWWSAARWSWSALGMAKHSPGPMKLASWWVASRRGRGVDVEVVGTCAERCWTPRSAPGCSFATTTPMAMVAPVATKAAERVSRRRDVGATPGFGESDDGRGAHRPGSRIGIGLMEEAAGSIRLNYACGRL